MPVTTVDWPASVMAKVAPVVVLVGAPGSGKSMLATRLPGLLPMPFNRTGLRGLYCVGDSCFPGQGLNAVAFSGFACAHRIGADLGLNPWALPA